MTQMSPEENSGAGEGPFSSLLLPEGQQSAVKVADLIDVPDQKFFIRLACSATEPMQAEAYKRTVMARVQIYVKQSRQARRIHAVLQLTIFVGAALVTVALAIPEAPKVVPALLSAVVAVATGVVNYYKFGERGRDLFRTAEELGLEHNRFDTYRGAYKDLDPEESYALFMDRVEAIISEQTRRSFAFVSEKPKEEQK